MTNESMTNEEFAEQYSRYFGRTVSFMVRRGSQIQDAQDFAQSAWTLALQCLHQFEGRSSMFTWVCKIAVNVERESRRRRSAEQLNEATEAALSVSAKFDDELATEDQLRWLRQAVDRVKHQGQRAALQARMSGTSEEDIAAALDKELNTVKCWVYRGKVAVRAMAARA